MPDAFRDQPGVRLAVGAVITAFVWGLYLVRVAFGIGPMHDHEGNQAPAVHYLIGALVVTAMVTVWIVVNAVVTHFQKKSGKPPERKA